MIKKKIVWDLFGGGQNSVFSALKNNELYEVYTFDVTDSTRKHHYIQDLAEKKDILFKYFDKLPKPDIIVASPLCQSFSSIKSMKGGGTACWMYNENKTRLKRRTEESFYKNRSGWCYQEIWEHDRFIAILGEKCLLNTIALIERYKPKFWYIENPKSSYMWKYISLNLKKFWCSGIQNFTKYGEYGYPATKPTCFFSNVKLSYIKNTKGFRIIGGDMRKLTGRNKLRQQHLTTKQIQEADVISHIPSKLICDIFKSYE